MFFQKNNENRTKSSSLHLSVQLSQYHDIYVNIYGNCLGK